MTTDPTGLYEEFHEDIWKSLEEAWNNYSANDVENFLKYCDQRFIGCHPETPFAVDKSWLDKWVRNHLSNVKFQLCHLTRQNLQLYDENVAAAVYGLDLIEENSQGQKQYLSQRHTVVLRRKTKRWTIAAAHIEILDQHLV